LIEKAPDPSLLPKGVPNSSLNFVALLPPHKTPKQRIFSASTIMKKVKVVKAHDVPSFAGGRYVGSNLSGFWLSQQKGIQRDNSRDPKIPGSLLKPIATPLGVSCLKGIKEGSKDDPQRPPKSGLKGHREKLI